MLQPEKKTYPRESRVLAIHKLRVNVKSLAAEARIIRKEEARAGEGYRSELMFHRRVIVRDESRYAGLALAFVRGRTYASVEGTSIKLVETHRLANKIAKAWPRYEWENKTVLKADVDAWVCAERE